MGMFDHYIPDPKLSCHRCDQGLSGWQGKDGLNLLFHWRQNTWNPIDTDWNEEDMVGTKDEFFASEIHPDGEFVIYTTCPRCGPPLVNAKIIVRGGLWESTALMTPEEVERAFYYLPKADRTAIRKSME